MRDTETTSRLWEFTNGGKDPNYLVRSWASSLGTVTQGHKAPKSDYRSKWLQKLNHVELMQNVEVQQILRKMMSILKAEDEILQDSNSAHEFAERRRIEKCHEAVCKIRESELMQSTQFRGDLKSKPSYERGIAKGSDQTKEKTVRGNKARPPGYNTAKNVHLNSDDSYQTYSHKERIQNGVNDYKFYYNNNNNNKLPVSEPDTQVERKGSVPPIPEATQEKFIFQSRKVRGQRSLLPTLDAASKFSIIKRAKEIRNERNAEIKNPNLSSMSSHVQVQRKFPKVRKESIKNSRKIEIFADNRKILSDEPKVTTENAPVTLPLLDSKSFIEIDCNDYLNIKNRLDGLSPVRAVLDHKLHWPNITKHK